MERTSEALELPAELWRSEVGRSLEAWEFDTLRLVHKRLAALFQPSGYFRKHLLHYLLSEYLLPTLEKLRNGPPKRYPKNQWIELYKGTLIDPRWGRVTIDLSRSYNGSVAYPFYISINVYPIVNLSPEELLHYGIPRSQISRERPTTYISLSGRSDLYYFKQQGGDLYQVRYLDQEGREIPGFICQCPEEHRLTSMKISRVVHGIRYSDPSPITVPLKKNDQTNQ